MPNPITIESKIVLIADLNKSDLILSIEAAIDYYIKLYGSPSRVWINSKDNLDNIQIVKGFKIERKNGCPRNKVMII